MVLLEQWRVRALATPQVSSSAAAVVTTIRFMRGAPSSLCPLMPCIRPGTTAQQRGPSELAGRRVARPGSAKLPRVEFDLPSWRRPLFVSPLEEPHSLLERHGAVLLAEHDPRPVGVVLRDREAVLGHERMFA